MKYSNRIIKIKLPTMIALLEYKDRFKDFDSLIIYLIKCERNVGVMKFIFDKLNDFETSIPPTFVNNKK